MGGDCSIATTNQKAAVYGQLSGCSIGAPCGLSGGIRGIDAIRGHGPDLLFLSRNQWGGYGFGDKTDHLTAVWDADERHVAETLGSLDSMASWQESIDASIPQGNRDSKGHFPEANPNSMLRTRRAVSTGQAEMRGSERGDRVRG